MASFGGPNWEALLRQSDEIVSGIDTNGFPRIERDISQLADATKQLKSKTSRREAGSELNAANRLLSQQGFDSERLTQDLQMVELTTTFEDVYPTEAANVEEFVQQVHDASVISAVQQAQKDTLKSFDDFLLQSLEADWASDKKQLLNYFGRSLTPAPASAPTSPYVVTRTPYSHVKGTQRLDSSTPSITPTKPSRHLPARYGQYAIVAKELNTAVLHGTSFNAAAAFGQAVERDPKSAVEGSGSVTLGGCWSLLASLLKGSDLQDGVPVSGEDKVLGLLRGARKHLEIGHSQYVLEVIRQNPAIASLGGSTSNRSKIQAFLRVRYRDAGALDFDRMGGIDTCWQQIYYCLRSGFYEEALSICQECQDVSLAQLGGMGLAPLLTEWLEGRRDRNGSVHSALDAECERLLRERASWSESIQHKAMIFSIITGNKLVADRLHSDYLFRTFEDFMWFKLALVRGYASGSVPLDSPISPTIRAEDRTVFTLLDFQGYLKQFEPTHYTKNGREPLLYVTVLLLSLQFGEVISFLSRDPSADAYRCDAVHFAIAFMHHDLFSLGGLNAKAMDAEQDASSIVHSYARVLSSEDPKLGLQYYALVEGAKASISAALLRELLVENHCFDIILGPLRADGDGGELSRFLPDRGARQRLLAEAGRQCENAAQFDEARSFYMHAGFPGSALGIVNRKLSEACVKLTSSDGSREDQHVDLVRTGEAAVQTIRSGMGMEPERDGREVDCFEQLVRVKDFLLYAGQGRNPDALRVLSTLQFVPLEHHRVDKCASDVQKLHPAVVARLPEILLCAAECLYHAASTSTGEAARGLQEQVRCIESFAGSTRVRVPAHVCAQLSRIASALG